MPLTIQPVTTKERLHKLVDELSEAEADETLRFAVARHENQGTALGQAIAAGYERIPQAAEEDAWALANARDAIREERW
jgi:hypothetical protein